LTVANGDEAAFAGDRDFVWHNRYLLSSGVLPRRFTSEGLHEALEQDLALLGSDLAFLVKRTLPSDPTGEGLRLIDRFAGGVRPHSRGGVWFSSDDQRAILLLQTRAAGFDIDAQQRALSVAASAFEGARRDLGVGTAPRLLATGPGVFAVDTRVRMQQDASRF